MPIYKANFDYTFDGPPNATFPENFSFNGKVAKASRTYVNFPIGKFTYGLVTGLPSTTIRDISWSPNGKIVSFSCSEIANPDTTDPCMSYRFDGSSFTSIQTSWIGAQPVFQSYACAWSPDGRYLAYGGSGPKKIDVLRLFSDLGLGSANSLESIYNVPSWGAYSDGATCTGISWSPSGSYLAATFSQEPFVYVYKFSDLSLSSSELSGYSALDKNYSVWATSCSWSPDEKYLAVGYKKAPYIAIYKFDGKSFKKLTESVDTPKSPVNDLSWSPDGQFLSAAHSESPVISAFSFDSKNLSLLSVLAERSSSDSCHHVTWSPDGRYLGATFVSAPKFGIYIFDGIEFKKVDYPQSLDPNATAAYAMEWSPDGENLVLNTALAKSSPGVSFPGPMLKMAGPANRPL